jgi:hypothetical protein
MKKRHKSLFSSLQMLVKVKLSYYMPGHILGLQEVEAPKFSAFGT